MQLSSRKKIEVSDAYKPIKYKSAKGSIFTVAKPNN
jgi:hypothetical protein